MTPLIDATEMYLRTVWELEEEGIPPIRARLVDRLGLSAPAVSETVHRLVEEGLLDLDDGRLLALTERGREIAVDVMRKHRLAERLLTDVIGLPWEQAHNEACRWEHVISDAVADRLVEILGDPQTSPFGNPIPSSDPMRTWSDLQTVAEVARHGRVGTIERISEQLQVHEDAMRRLADAGIGPGVRARFHLEGSSVVAVVDDRDVHIDSEASEHLYVKAE